MAKKITFDIELNVNGQNMVVRASQDVRELQKAVSTVQDGTRRAVDEFMGFGGAVATIQGMTNGIEQVSGVIQGLIEDYNAQEEAELKLQTVMRQRMKASDDDVDAIKRLASEQQKIGVVGDEVQLAGAQQVATFLNEKSSIEQLLPAMNNLAVQRKGLNVTAEDMVNIGNLVGKVMQGNVGALTRVGITFDDAQKHVLQYGTETERAAMLAEVITDNVGNMNAELAKTDAGHAKQLANTIGDLKEQVGQALSSWQPFIQATSQIGLTITGILSMGTAIKGAVTYVTRLSLVSRIAAGVQNLFGMAVRGVRAFVLTGSAANAVYSRTLTATSAASRTAAVSATTLGIAIRGLLVATGVGAVVAALTFGLQKLLDALDDTGTAAKDASDSIDTVGESAKSAQEAFVSAQSEMYSRLMTKYTELKTSAMKAANTMAGKDAEGFVKLKDQVAEFSKTIPMARDQLANGLYQVISNGVPEDNWISYLQASAKSAVGGIADVGEVVKVTSTIIKNYGLEWSAAQDIQDKIQLTAKNGVTSFEQLAAALPSVTGQAAQLGVSFTEMLAVMSTLTGVTGNTSEVATQLSSVLTALTKESAKSQKMAEAMGISFNAASIKAAGGLRNYLQELDKTVTAYAAKTGELKESIYSKLFGRAEALRLVNALTGNLVAKFDEKHKDSRNSAGQ